MMNQSQRYISYPLKSFLFQCIVKVILIKSKVQVCDSNGAHFKIKTEHAYCSLQKVWVH